MSAEIVRVFAGLDLGQSRDPSALAVVERAEVILDERDYVTYEYRRAMRFRVQFVERMRLGTPYPAVVERVRLKNRVQVMPGPRMARRCELVMDATGCGRRAWDAGSRRCC